MSDEIITIVYERMTEFTEQFTNTELLNVLSRPWDYPDELITAITKHLEEHPPGMTREQFNQLPDGSVVQSGFNERFVVIDGDIWALGGSPGIDSHLSTMSVVSTPPAPTLDDAQFVLTDDGVWYRVDLDDWACRNSKLTTAELRGIYPTAVILLPGPQIGGDQ